MIELYCETDFVARNPEFKALAHDLAMYIAAMSPMYQSLDAIPEEAWNAEKARFNEEVSKMDKSDNVKADIVKGKLSAHFGSLSLLSQPFIKEQEKTVADSINEAI